MGYCFDEIVDRKNSHSLKWEDEELIKEYGSTDVLPMSIADMDFRSAPPIVDALTDYVQRGLFGYNDKNRGIYASAASWMERRHGWSITEKELSFAPGVIPGLVNAIQALTKPGQKIIVQEPVYKPLRDAVVNNGRILSVNPLRLVNGRYEMDLEDFEKKASEPNVGAFLLCSPHNPVGRVWSKEELEAVGNICLEKNIPVIDDEIHNDLIIPGHEHTVFASISPEFANNSVILFSPSKSFNIAGLKSSFAGITNPEWMRRFEENRERNRIGSPTCLGVVGVMAAYDQSAEWLDDLMPYIKGNFEAFSSRLKAELPDVWFAPMEGTFLCWCNFSAYTDDWASFEKNFASLTKVGLKSGTWFGQGGEGFMRVNLACSRSRVIEGAERIISALKR